MMWLLLLLVVPNHEVAANQKLVGEVSAVYDLIGRVLDQAPHPFRLQLTTEMDREKHNSNDQHTNFNKNLYFQLEDYYNTTAADSKDQHQILVTATTASELSAGVGWYLRERCNMTIGWPRGGGSRIRIPKSWPKIATEDGITIVNRLRQVPWSYLMVSQ